MILSLYSKVLSSLLFFYGTKTKNAWSHFINELNLEMTFNIQVILLFISECRKDNYHFKIPTRDNLRIYIILNFISYFLLKVLFLYQLLIPYKSNLSLDRNFKWQWRAPICTWDSPFEQMKKLNWGVGVKI